MRAAREDAYVALVSFLAGLQWAGKAIEVTRRFQALSQISPARLPMIIVALGDETSRQQQGQPTIRAQTPDLYIYAKAQKPEDGGPLIHGLIDLVEARLLPPPGQAVQTLGGKVASCQMSGVVGIWEDPAETGLVVATTPISILMT